MSIFGSATIPSVKNQRTSAPDDVDFEIKGAEMQFVEVELDPGESAIAEAGAMMFKDATVRMDTIFGDGRQEESGFFSKLAAAGKRLLTGAGLFLTLFTQESAGKARVAFAAPYPGRILAFKLDKFGGSLICQKDAFLCAARGVAISIYFQKKIMTGLFGGGGFMMQKLEGEGWVFVHGGGTLMERELRPGEVLHVDAGCLAAMTEGVELDIERVGSVKSMIFGGEGIFFARLTGPGKIWVQSLPLSRLAAKIVSEEGGKASGGVSFSISSSSSSRTNI